MSSDEKPESLSGLAADVLVLLAQARESLQWFHGFSHCVEPEKHRFYSQELINFANTLRIIQIKASEHVDACRRFPEQRRGGPFARLLHGLSGISGG